MGNIYIAINGDDVGNRIGDAIANDDHEGLAQASSSIQNAHDTIDQWVDSVGGKKISRAGDDAIYLVPEQAVNDLDSVREQYKQESGHGLTVGVGPSMSQASKALIYGKLNGKDQTIHYEPGIEDYLSDDEQDAQPEVPEQDELQDQADTDVEADAGAADLEGAPETEDVDDSQSAVPNAEGVDPEADPNAAPDMEADPQASQEGDMDAEPPAGNEDDMAEDDQTQTDAPAEPVANSTPAQNNKPPMAAGGKPPMAGNVPAIDGKTGVDNGTSKEDLNQDAGVDDPAAMQGTDENLPDTDAEADAAAGGPPQAGDENSEDMSDENADPNAEAGDDGSQPAELSQDDVADPNAEEGQEDPNAEMPAEDDGEDPVASMIHGDMQDGGSDEEASDLEQNPDADSSIDDELRQDIAEALVSFKENKQMLEQAREQNPELYNATLTMLRSMIAMAKKLGYGPEQDMADREAEQQLDQEFPEAGAEGEGEDPTEDMPNEEESEDDSAPDASAEEQAPSDKKGPPPAKK